MIKKKIKKKIPNNNKYNAYINLINKIKNIILKKFFSLYLIYNY